MADPQASLTFLPWMRRGISAAVGDDAKSGARRAIPVDVSFGQERTAAVTLGLLGPGQVMGLDSRMVIRTWPAANTYDAEPNFFPIVEFDQPDLPWRYTPVGVSGKDRLQPWRLLLVLKDEEIGAFVPASPTRPLAVVTVSNAPLPLLDQAWAWAHVQVTGVQSTDPASTATIVANDPAVSENSGDTLA